MNMDIDKLEAGRELDALVAEMMGYTDLLVSPHNGELIGLPVGHSRPKSGNTANHKMIPHYSTDIAAAWKIVEKAKELFSSSQWELFCTELCNNWKLLRGNANGDAPLSICRAALKALQTK